MNYFSDWTEEDIKKYYARINKKPSKNDFNIKDDKLSTQNKKSKYRANKVEIDGIKFDSQKEGNYYNELKNYSSERYQLAIRLACKTSQYKPTLSQMLDLIAKVKTNTQAEEKEKCEFCNGTGYYLYRKIENGYPYEYACTCICQNAQEKASKMWDYDKDSSLKDAVVNLLSMEVDYLQKFSETNRYRNMDNLTDEDKEAYNGIVSDLNQAQNLLNQQFTNLQDVQEAFAAKHGLKLE